MVWFRGGIAGAHCEVEPMVLNSSMRPLVFESHHSGQNYRIAKEIYDGRH
jgi:hypothetical protein